MVKCREIGNKIQHEENCIKNELEIKMRIQKMKN